MVQTATDERVIHGLNINSITTAPLQLVQTARLKASPEDVFAVVSDHAGMHKWTPVISKVQLDCGQAAVPGGEGTLRYCLTPAGLTIQEKIVAWQPPIMYGYSVRNFQTLLPNHLGLITSETDGNGGAILTWRTYFQSSRIGGPMARMALNVVLPNLVGNLVKHFGGEMIAA